MANAGGIRARLGLRTSFTVGERRNGAGEPGSIPQDRLVVTGGLRPAPGWELGARATVLRDMDDSDLPEDARPTDGAQILDIFANWQPQDGVLQGTAISAGIDNLVDETDRVHPNGLNNSGLTAKVAIGRTF